MRRQFATSAILAGWTALCTAQDNTNGSTTGSYPPNRWNSVTWWPGPPFQTVSGPISPIETTPTVTTSLTGIPSFTSSNVSVTSPPYPTATSNATTNSTLPACKKVQYNFASGQGSDQGKAEAIRDAYVYSWNAYKEYAFGMDELLPLNASGINDWYGWGVTIVDGIDTAIVMNLTDIVQEQLSFIQNIDFTTTTYGPVEIFDTNIRYVGGLLSAYDLLKSGLFYNNYPRSQINALLSQAVVLADKIAYGFDSPTGLAASNVNFTDNTPVFGTYTVEPSNVTYNATNTASTGTFVREYCRLSTLTGNATYCYLAERAESYLVNPSPAPVYPGLVGTEFDVDTGRMITFDGGWHSGEIASMHKCLLS